MRTTINRDTCGEARVRGGGGALGGGRADELPSAKCIPRCRFLSSIMMGRGIGHVEAHLRDLRKLRTTIQNIENHREQHHDP